VTQPRRPTRDTVGGRVYLELRRQARADGRDTGELLQLYALEGFLDRLTRSPYADLLVLKGGVLLAAFDTRRPTRDIDVAGIGLDGSPNDVLAAIRGIAAVPVDDGLAFDDDAATAATIREDTQYGGVRVSMPCALERANLRFHVDVNLGDPIHPGPRAVDLPRLLGGSIRLLGYPLSMVVAEKLVTAVERGQVNTRWRDFGDLFHLSLRHDHDGTELTSAVRAVASHRGVELHGATVRPDGYAEFAQPRWAVWRRRQRLDDLPERFDDVLVHLVSFTTAVLDGSAPGRRWVRQERAWTPAA
jgi:hypothetical protein